MHSFGVLLLFGGVGLGVAGKHRSCIGGAAIGVGQLPIADLALRFSSCEIKGFRREYEFM